MVQYGQVLMKSQIRKFKETDRDFITKSLLFSFMNGSKEIQRINRDSYMQSHNIIANTIINRCFCLISCDQEDPDLIYGFILFEHMPKFDILHYVYIRKPFRKNKIASELISSVKNSKQLALTHLTDEFKPARLKKYWEKVIYDPYTR